LSALEEWSEGLRSWAIPEAILEAAPESPFGFPVELFRHRTETAVARDPSPTLRLAAEALPAGGSLLDVGAGGGAASLPLAPKAGLITAVDASEELLREFLASAEVAGVPARAVQGTWPDVAGEVEAVDVVVCSHVLYNVQDLGPFAQALSERSRRRVVIEITRDHPVAWMNGLWLHFHGIARPDRPTSDTAEAAFVELGLPVEWIDHDQTIGGGFESRADTVALIRRRLCLSAEADPQVEEALGGLLFQADGLWSAGPPQQRVTTLWWDL
jgi:precorrin-6B methylase 2